MILVVVLMAVVVRMMLVGMLLLVVVTVVTVATSTYQADKTLCVILCRHTSRNFYVGMYRSHRVWEGTEDDC